MNSLASRLAVAAVILVFAWKGAVVEVLWPPRPDVPAVSTTAPEPALLKWADPLKPILPKMLPSDRMYLASLYDAMAFVLKQDRERDVPIIGSMDSFRSFHANTLKSAIERLKVGRYEGLDAAIDTVYINANGAEAKPVTADGAAKLIAASQVLSYVLGIRGDE